MKIRTYLYIAVDWLVSLNEQAAFLRARRTCKATSTLPAPFLPSCAAQHNKKLGGASGTSTGAHQNCTGRPHHEARDESLYTCPPSQSGGFVDRLHTHKHTNTGGSFNTSGAIRVSPVPAGEAGRAVRYLQNGSVFSARLLAAEHLLQFIHRGGGSLRNRLDVVEERIGTLPGAIEGRGVNSPVSSNG